MYGRRVETTGDVRFYTVMVGLWAGLAIWQIVNLFLAGNVFERSTTSGLLYVFLTLALMAWSSWNTYDITKDLLSHRARIKEDA